MKCVSVHCHSASWKHLDFLKNNLKFVESQPFTPNYSVESPPGADPNQYQSHPDQQRNNISWELGKTESHQKECESHHETTLQNYLGSPEDKGSSFCSCLPLSPHWSEWCMIIMLELSEIDYLFPHFVPKLAVWHDRFWTEIANVYSWNRDSNRHSPQRFPISSRLFHRLAHQVLSNLRSVDLMMIGVGKTFTSIICSAKRSPASISSGNLGFLNWTHWVKSKMSNKRNIIHELIKPERRQC